MTYGSNCPLLETPHYERGAPETGVPAAIDCHDIDDMIERVAVVFALAAAFGPMIATAIKAVLED